MTLRDSDIPAGIGVVTLDGQTTVAHVRRRDADWSIQLSADTASVHGRAPRATCLDDARLLYRPLDLPPAERAVTQQMVSAQIEAILPGRLSQFAWTWDRCETTGRVWLCAAKRESVDDALRHHGVTSVVAAASAIAAGINVVLPDLTGRLLVIHPNTDSTSMLVLDAGVLTAAFVLEPGLAAWRRQPAACALQASETLDAEYHDKPRDARPARLLLLATAVDPEPIAQRLGLRPLNEKLSAELLAAAAIGAAVTAMGRANPALDLAAKPVESAAPKRTIPRRRVKLAVWLVVALLAIYAVDIWRARAMAKAAVTAAGGPNPTANADERLRVGRYLEGLGQPPLAVLDEVSKLAGDQIQLIDFRYSHREGVRFRGIAPNGDELNKLIESLGKATTLERVELLQQKTVNEKAEFELAARLHGVAVRGGRP